MNRVIAIGLSMLLMMSMMAVLSTSSVSQSLPNSVRGYVYIDEIIQKPDQIIMTLDGEERAADELFDDGFYIINHDGDDIQDAEFTVEISLGSFVAEKNQYDIKESGGVTIYYINLSVNTSEIPNNPPNTPANPDPIDGQNDVSISKTLSWDGGDPDGDSVEYDVYFGSSNPPSKVKSNQSGTSYPGTMDYDTEYYWKIVAWDEHDQHSEGSVWSFKTKSSPSPGDDDDDDVTPGDDDDDSTPPGGGGGGTVIQNQPPTAAATVDVTTGNPGLICTFDASDSSDSDGEILEYQWDFDDVTTETTINATISHTFTYTGTFNVMLTVTDDDGATDEIDEPITIEIKPGNNPPTDLVVTPETTKTKKNTEVQFSITATDPDDNDTIHYNVSWGDTETITSAEYNSSELFEVGHRWDNYGVYTVTVTAYDSQNASSETITTTMYVDVHPITGEISGLLIDEDSDGTYDTFKDDTTETTLEKHNESNYLIDSNNDGEWDYMYDVDSETLTTYSTDEPDEADGSNMAVYLLLGLIIVLFIVFGYLAYTKQQHEKKNAEKRKKAETKKQNKKKSSSKKKK